MEQHRGTDALPPGWQRARAGAGTCALLRGHAARWRKHFAERDGAGNDFAPANRNVRRDVSVQDGLGLGFHPQLEPRWLPNALRLWPLRFTRNVWPQWKPGL